MFARSLVALVLVWPTIAAGQLTGRFYLEKQTFAPGEPVFLYFEVTNSGAEVQNVERANPYSFCSGYSVRLSGDVTLDSSSSCAPIGTGGSCGASDSPLAPGKNYTDRILLNYQHNLRTPGYYEVDALKQLVFVPSGIDFFSAVKSSIEVHQYLHFWIDENALPDDSEMQAWVRQLSSPDASMRHEAALVLASVAPKSLEDLLLTFSNNREFQGFAPMAFHRLGTPRSITALAELLRKSPPGTNESVESANFLAEAEDPKWFPLLLDIAQKNPGDFNYLYNAAESGGDKILPILLPMIHSSDDNVKASAVSALGYTGSRAAVPILLDLLRSSDSEIAQRALYSLRDLTHRSVGGERWLDPQAQYSVWAQWWNAEGLNGAIYKASQCGAVTSLK